MRDREFRGFELQTLLGSLAIGRGYTHIAGEDLFTGLAIDLPFGRVRLGWRIWTESDGWIPEPRRIAEEIASFVRHLLFAGVVVGALLLLDVGLDTGTRYVEWVIGIWAILLALHLLNVVLPCIDKLIEKLEGGVRSLISGRRRPR